MNNDRHNKAIIPEVLPSDSVENDVFVQRNQHGKIVNQYSITKINGETYRTREQVIYQSSPVGEWLQMVGAIAIGFVGLYLLVWAIGFAMKHSGDEGDRSTRIEVVRNV